MLAYPLGLLPELNHHHERSSSFLRGVRCFKTPHDADLVSDCHEKDLRVVGDKPWLIEYS